MTKARDYIDYWIENSIHATEQYGNAGGSQNVSDLARRLVDAAKGQGISEVAMTNEVGDLTEYLKNKLRTANKKENDRQK